MCRQKILSGTKVKETVKSIVGSEFNLTRVVFTSFHNYGSDLFFCIPVKKSRSVQTFIPVFVMSAIKQNSTLCSIVRDP